MPMFAFLNTQTLIIILVVALVVFGPHKLPEIGRQLGNAMRELRKMSGDMQRALEIDGHSTSYDHYSSSSYDSAASYNYTPPPNVPLDQYFELETAPSTDESLEASPDESEAEPSVEPAKPKRSRRKRVDDMDAVASTDSEQPSVEAAVSEEAKPSRASRSRKAVSDSGTSEASPKPRSRRTARAVGETPTPESAPVGLVDVVASSESDTALESPIEIEPEARLAESHPDAQRSSAA